jgi:hypothetical protein
MKKSTVEKINHTASMIDAFLKLFYLLACFAFIRGNRR